MTLRFIDFKTSEPQNIEGYIRFAQFVLIRLSGKNKGFFYGDLDFPDKRLL
jgi:hypothetical protein